MTYHDPQDRDDPVQNREWYREDGRVTGSVFLTLILGAIIAFGVIMYATSDHSILTANTPNANPIPSTTGQGSAAPRIEHGAKIDTTIRGAPGQ
jgi:hypothetical protein